MRAVLSRLIANNFGVTAIEYALIGSLVGMVAIAAKATIGTTLSGFFVSVANGL
jgi:Flp pilus assembly pilin Flp